MEFIAKKKERPRARLMTLVALYENVIPLWFDPPPKPRTVEGWMKEAGVPRYKANLKATAGGGISYWSVPHVERMLRAKAGLKGGAS